MPDACVPAYASAREVFFIRFGRCGVWSGPEVVEYHVSEAGAQAVLAEMQLPRLRLLLQSSTLLGAVVTAAFAMVGFRL
jgi:hypothetical protein